jgi:hypothetical protein
MLAVRSSYSRRRCVNDTQGNERAAPTSQQSLIERAPRYLFHKPSGRGDLRFDGRLIYFGRYNSKSGVEAYDRYVTEWVQNGGRLANGRKTSITDLVVAYTEFATGYYR